MKILNFGSLNVDYIYEVEHFVLPGETISSKHLTVTSGGKGLNQSIALAKAGMMPFHAGAIGKADQDMFIGLLNNSGVNTDYIKILPEPSGHAIIQVDQNGQNCIILHGGTNQQINGEFVDRVLEHFNSGDILLLQNEIASIPYMMERAHEKGMRIYFNPSPANQKLYDYPMDYVDTLILNEVEGEQLTGEKNVNDIIAHLLKKYPEMKIVLTLGERGVEYADKDRREYHGIYENKVVDTTAAGDTFTGYFIGSIAKEMDIKEALKYASAAAAIAVSKLGAACSIPSLEEVEDFL
ncbi:ribokinase [Geosporobacter ferrireducens]|uniref:Ribokinase n=1 Tax=Geosporobacter ferrireducens TaxID=1424294 RepID=A0A1D8GFH7_9FIRM|nr:ribokinase [Geosporobacter ferrireducens]AOT69664.1 ribokinase [Geosporobacter ferrireducens]MTI54631.1 ribokinase [Geosporobacter ferrireducens]